MQLVKGSYFSVAASLRHLRYAFFHVQILKGAKSISSRANCVYELFL